VIVLLALIMPASITITASVVPSTKPTKEASRHCKERHRQSNS
jgi:hypothetical protein